MSKQALEKLWDRAMSAKTQAKRDYWLNRYEIKKNKVYAERVRKIRPINDILNERSSQCS